MALFTFTFCQIQRVCFYNSQTAKKGKKKILNNLPVVHHITTLYPSSPAHSQPLRRRTLLPRRTHKLGTRPIHILGRRRNTARMRRKRGHGHRRNCRNGRNDTLRFDNRDDPFLNHCVTAHLHHLRYGERVIARNLAIWTHRRIAVRFHSLDDRRAGLRGRRFTGCCGSTQRCGCRKKR